MTPREKALWVKMKQGKKTEGCQGKMEAGHFDRHSFSLRFALLVCSCELSVGCPPE